MQKLMLDVEELQRRRSQERAAVAVRAARAAAGNGVPLALEVRAEGGRETDEEVAEAAAMGLVTHALCSSACETAVSGTANRTAVSHAELHRACVTMGLVAEAVGATETGVEELLRRLEMQTRRLEERQSR